MSFSTAGAARTDSSGFHDATVVFYFRRLYGGFFFKLQVLRHRNTNNKPLLPPHTSFYLSKKKIQLHARGPRRYSATVTAVEVMA